MTKPVPIGKLLKNVLDDLTEARLREFQWYLVQIQVDGFQPIPTSRLERATRVTTVDKLLDTFGEDGAVERTVDTLSEMNLNDLASKLVQAKMDQMNQSMEQQVDEPGTSSARKRPREDDPTVPDDLSCSICLSLFTDPVVLQCGHSFCWTCIHEDWERNTVRECSLCKKLSFGGDPPINLNLKSLCENYRGRSQGDPSGGHRNNTESFQTCATEMGRYKRPFMRSINLSHGGHEGADEENMEQQSVADETDEVTRESVSAIESLVHQIQHKYTAQGGSNMVAPIITGNVGNLNISIILTGQESNVGVNRDTAETLQSQRL